MMDALTNIKLTETGTDALLISFHLGGRKYRARMNEQGRVTDLREWIGWAVAYHEWRRVSPRLRAHRFAEVASMVEELVLTQGAR